MKLPPLMTFYPLNAFIIYFLFLWVEVGVYFQIGDICLEHNSLDNIILLIHAEASVSVH